MYSEKYNCSDMNENEIGGTSQPKTKIINSTDLVEERFERIDWVVDGLLKPGLSVLAGSPKVGKSWMVLQLCLAVAKGEPFWGMETRRGRVLYITLEDSKPRIRDRLLRITDEVSENLDILLSCPGIGVDLESLLAGYTIDHPDARMIVIDTFQKIREQTAQMSYANDYADISSVKNIADQLNISILLVHHTRKLGDSDYINEISGTNGIAGSADTLMILKREKRSERSAVLSCTGRDIEDRMFELNMDRESCVWNMVSDTYNAEPKTFPPMLLRLIVFAGKLGYYEGSNTEFCERFCDFTGESIIPSHLKKMMNLYRYELEDAGVFFLSVKRGGTRRLAVYFKKREDAAALSDEEAAEEAALWDAPRECVPAGSVRQEPAPDDMPPTPGDEDAPPVRRDEEGDYDRFAYKPYQ